MNRHLLDYYFKPLTFNTNAFDDLLNGNTPTQYESTVNDNGQLEIVVNLLGHDKSHIDVNATESEIKLKSEKPEDSSSFVKDVNITLSLSEKYDGTTSTANFDNGLLFLTVDLKKESKYKKIKL